ncbi:hypothetical protein NJ76_28590 [Rhodococcus sp. IITR03]|nr:hypothetical protein NJ76_28590 [Rhodococcus sp. IITR03]
MLLADLGDDVKRVDRATSAGLVGPNTDFRTESLHRGRRPLGESTPSAPTNGGTRAQYTEPPPKPDRSPDLAAPTRNRRTEEGVDL